MRAVKLIGLAVAAGVALAACSSKVYVQRDETAHLARGTTYMWIDTKANQNDTRSVTAFAQREVRTAVNQQLAKEGWTEVNNNPDVLVSYDILVQRSTQLQSDPVYTQPFTRTYFNPYMRRWGTIYYPSQFIGYDNYNVPVREGTITITITDAHTDKAVWQAWTTETLDNTKMTANVVDKSVKNIFKKFDVASR